ncbi:MAG: ATP-binding protein [Prevotella sp.]
MMKKQIILGNRIDELHALTAFIQAYCESCQLSSEVVFNLQLALEECVTNVIMYAYPAGEQHSILVSAELQEPHLVFTIEDTGLPFDPTKVSQADTTQPAEVRPIGGLGIFLARQLVDTMTYRRETDKNILTLRKKVR